MKMVLIILSLFAFMPAAYSADLSQCPSGRRGQAAATKANFINAMATGTRWYNPAGGGEQQIVFQSPAVFTLDYQGSYKGQFPRKTREIVLDRDLGNTVFTGAMVIAGRLVVQMDEIYFTNKDGKCAFVTKTNPDEYHSSTIGQPYSSSAHHILDDGNGNKLTKFGKEILVLRSYTWVKAD